jgi:hypothetical protein
MKTLAFCGKTRMLPVMTTDAGTQQAAPWTADASTFGARLALVRQHMGWGNVKTAAEKCGLPVESWRNWERDGVEPRRLTTIAMTIASVAGCDYLWLVHGPDRGSVRPTTRYAGEARVIARGGENRPRGGLITTRPVTQTRPIGRQSRPFTPVAV